MGKKASILTTWENVSKMILPIIILILYNVDVSNMIPKVNNSIYTLNGEEPKLIQQGHRSLIHWKTETIETKVPSVQSQSICYSLQQYQSIFEPDNKDATRVLHNIAKRSLDTATKQVKLTQIQFSKFREQSNLTWNWSLEVSIDCILYCGRIEKKKAMQNVSVRFADDCFVIL